MSQARKDQPTEAWVREALNELPSDVQRVLDKHGINVVIKDQPSATIREEFGRNLFGLFTGVPLSEQSGPGVEMEPTRIELYEAVFEEAFDDRGEMKEQVQLTVAHEVGHFLGMDEEDLRERGL